MRIVTLVACCSAKKEERCPAEDLYCSDWFIKARAWATWMSPDWFILSALHGLVTPRQEVDPYNFTWEDRKKQGFNPMQFKAYTHNWGTRAITCVLREIGWEFYRGLLDPNLNTEIPTIVLLGGKDYLNPIKYALSEFGLRGWFPLAGLGIGQQKSWLLDRNPLTPLDPLLIG